MKPSTRFLASATPRALALVAAAMLSAAATASWATEPSVATVEGDTATEVQPVTAKAPAISFGACHFQNTPPHDPHRRLECLPGEVVVAVYEQGVRCCALELR